MICIGEEVKKEYFEALYNTQFGTGQGMKNFRASHPLEYAHLNGMRQRRNKVRHELKVMRALSHDNVYFGTLTFDDVHDKNKIATKRKDAFKHLNGIFVAFFVVEEQGTENGRYHIHFCGCFKDGKTFNDFFQWHSRTDIKKVVKHKAVVNYLCDYVVKDVPRVRRNKTLTICSKRYKKGENWRVYGFDCLAVAHEKLAQLVYDVANT